MKLYWSTKIWKQITRSLCGQGMESHMDLGHMAGILDHSLKNRGEDEIQIVPESNVGKASLWFSELRTIPLKLPERAEDINVCSIV